MPASCNIAYAAIIVVLILISFHFVRAHKSKRKDKFLGPIVYNPCFIDPLGTGRLTCKGYTSGSMPSVETDQDGEWLCPGLLGVPI